MQRSSPVVATLLCAVTLCSAPVAAAQRPSREPPYIPTEAELVDAMLQLGGVDGDDLLFDLGSGDGRIVITAAQRFGTRGIGYEHQPVLVEISRARAESAGVGDLTEFVADDLFSADLREASVVMLYLGAAFNLRLRATLLSSLRPGARVVSNTFRMGEWQPDSTRHLGSGAGRASLHLWVIPARVDGFWSFAVEGDPSGYALELDQTFQTGSGTARSDGRDHPVSQLRIRGDSVEFTAHTAHQSDPSRFLGRVFGDRMEGVARTPDGDRGWIAVRFTHPGLVPPRSFNGHAPEDPPREPTLVTRQRRR